MKDGWLSEAWVTFIKRGSLAFATSTCPLKQRWFHYIAVEPKPGPAKHSDFVHQVGTPSWGNLLPPANCTATYKPFRIRHLNPEIVFVPLGSRRDEQVNHFHSTILQTNKTYQMKVCVTGERYPAFVSQNL